MAKIKVTLIKSIIGSKKDQIATVKALGLNKIGVTKEFENIASINGMVNKVSHLLKVEEI